MMGAVPSLSSLRSVFCLSFRAEYSSMSELQPQALEKPLRKLCSRYLRAGEKVWWKGGTLF